MSRYRTLEMALWCLKPDPVRVRAALGAALAEPELDAPAPLTPGNARRGGAGGRHRRRVTSR
ncbi:hypothetical protein WME79_23330 [Sorangium sp. So ce726]|uniref:hypothetical protein n=1 Tax=Sorangium sp. So ce726 TaxID=3133319 RepID=UPI003F6483BF